MLGCAPGACTLPALYWCVQSRNVAFVTRPPTASYFPAYHHHQQSPRVGSCAPISILFRASLLLRPHPAPPIQPQPAYCFVCAQFYSLDARRNQSIHLYVSLTSSLQPPVDRSIQFSSSFFFTINFDLVGAGTVLSFCIPSRVF